MYNDDTGSIEDYDLRSALSLAGVLADAVAADPLAVFAGDPDGPDWRWVLPMQDGTYGFLKGGCDYTGWDCQADVEITYVSTAEEAAALEDDPEVRVDLLRQLVSGRSETPRERVGRDLGLE